MTFNFNHITAFRGKESNIGLNGFHELHQSITETIYLCLHYARHEGTSGSGCTGTLILNPLKTNDIPLYLKAQFVPRCKHFSSRLYKPISLWCK